MTAYIIRRILFMIPTILGIMLVSFMVVQFAPGGPVERVIAQLSGSDTGATSRISGSQSGDFGSRGQVQGGSQVDAGTSKYRGAQGLDPDVWFQNVEVVAAKEIGRETVQYVSNIFKYYVAYKLALEKEPRTTGSQR